MDDWVLVLLAAIPVLMLLAAGMGFLRSRVRAERDKVVAPRDVGGVIGTKPPGWRTHLRRAAVPAGERAGIDACMARIFVKQSGRERPAACLEECFPPLALRQLEKAVDEHGHFREAHNILSRIDSLEDSLDDLVSLVATDPLLTAALLRLANSAFYGVSGEVTSIRNAISVVGLFNLKNLVYREYVLRQRKGAAIQDPALFGAVWGHSLLTATSAAFLAGAFPGVDPAGAYMAGPLHDIGKFLLLGADFVETGKDRCVRPYCGGFVRSTELVWRHDHALTGKLAALKWDFGPELATAIGMHHYPELVPMHRVSADKGAIRLATLIHVANQVAKHFSDEPHSAAYVAPLHFSYHHLVDQDAVRSILGDSMLISALAKTKASMASDGDG